MRAAARAPRTTTRVAAGNQPDLGRADRRGASDDAGAGARILAAALGVLPSTEVAWPPAGTVRPETLATRAGGGGAQVVLAPTALTGGDTPRAGPPPRPPGERRVRRPALRALVADADSEPPRPRRPAGRRARRVAEQRYLAELTLLSLQAPAPRRRPSSHPAARAWTADPDGVAAMIADTAEDAVAAPGGLDALAAGPATDAGDLAAAARGHAAPDPAGLDASRPSRSETTSPAPRCATPAAALAAYEAAIARTASVAWRDGAAGLPRGGARLRSTQTGCPTG